MGAAYYDTGDCPWQPPVPWHLSLSWAPHYGLPSPALLAYFRIIGRHQWPPPGPQPPAAADTFYQPRPGWPGRQSPRAPGLGCLVSCFHKISLSATNTAELHRPALCPLSPHIPAAVRRHEWCFKPEIFSTLMRLTPRVLVVFTIHELHSLSEPLTFVVTLQAQLLTLPEFKTKTNQLKWKIRSTIAWSLLWTYEQN